MQESSLGISILFWVQKQGLQSKIGIKWPFFSNNVPPKGVVTVSLNHSLDPPMPKFPYPDI